MVILTVFVGRTSKTLTRHAFKTITLYVYTLLRHAPAPFVVVIVPSAPRVLAVMGKSYFSPRAIESYQFDRLTDRVVARIIIVIVVIRALPM